jgi:hypothetical protein
MTNISTMKSYVYKTVTLVVITSILAISSAFAQAAQTAHTYSTELVVSEGKKSVETDADLTLNAENFTVVPDKKNFASSSKNIKYSDIKVADYSYSKKPMLSGGGAIATALLVGFIFALPFLFIKKKNHWMTIQTEKDFAVMKLGGDNFRQIRADFETHGVKVNEVAEEKDKKK